MPTFFSLFSGIGGIDLAFQLAGFEIAGQVEIDPYCRLVLAKNFPHVPRWGDITKVSGDEIISSSDGLVPDVIGGGFPCQDISFSNNKGQGLSGERSGLWREFARLIGELRPRIVFVENVPAITHRGGTEVIEDLTALGYDCEWAIIPASAVGAPHRRERFWLLGYASSQRHFRQAGSESSGYKKRDSAASGERRQTIFYEAFPTNKVLPNTPGKRHKTEGFLGRDKQEIASTASGDPRGNQFNNESRMVGAVDGIPCGLDGFRLTFPSPPNQPQHPWEAPRTVPKGTISSWDKRIESLGNAVVPQVVLPMARQIHKQLVRGV